MPVFSPIGRMCPIRPVPPHSNVLPNAFEKNFRKIAGRLRRNFLYREKRDLVLSSPIPSLRCLTMAKKSNIDVEKCSARLKAVSDSDRLRLIYQLRDGRKNVSTLADAIGVEIVNVSH